VTAADPLFSGPRGAMFSNVRVLAGVTDDFSETSNIQKEPM
jgi:hypothetical protein